MKKNIIWTLLVLTVTPFIVNAEISAKELEVIKKQVLDRYEIIPELIESPELKRFTSKKILQVKTVYSSPQGAKSSKTMKGFIDQDKFEEFESMSTTQKCDQLKKCFDKGITIKDNESAKYLEAALDVLYPVSSSDKKYKKIYQEGKNWVFIRGDFFKKFKGFIVTVDDQGVVKEINYSLKIVN